MIFHTENQVEWAVFSQWENTPEIFHAFTTRNGGDSEGKLASLNLGRSEYESESTLMENRRRFFQATEVPPDRTVQAKQVHGTTVQIVRDPGVIGYCDGLLTDENNLYLIIGVADCHTLFLHTKDYSVVGALHAGWRGIAGNILDSALSNISEQFGYSSSEVELAIGPGIGPCCYEVGPDVVSRFPADVIERREHSTYLDLSGAIVKQAKALGIPGSQIISNEHCTSCESEKWYSYRRDDGNTGRMWGVIAKTEGGKK
ncbi:MAG: peptidoglycan editing factor PgeF [Candidatus Marinimicrobia bacterium]|nr:peptidoglycan editing factor PgeF [Candidatus Neomarinimicrobiota bacterium]MCF7829817.1 peptidoglycan editing factor PgeF [Candidatus Neomarinimicrobiota bacterium]MCF7881750.1 peptidoglycan editing factor PgeF [Candidatus Neomarinimicrobiota bacterium]